MHRSTRYFFPVAILACLSPAAQAHPGHAHEVVSASSGWHWFLQPEHLALWLLCAACATAAWLVHSRRQRPKLIPVSIRRDR